MESMSLSQFGYSSSYSTNSSPLTSTQLLPPTSTSSSSPSSPPSMSTPCCDKGVPLTNPHTGQTVCSCQYTSGLLPYPRLPLPDPSSYPNSPYGSAPQAYAPLPTDPSAFYPPLSSPYDLKEAGETWRGLSQPSPCYPYETAPMGPYHYPNAYGGVDINSAARRKNATRENTNTLKAWLYEHRKNPYPTKGEKIMLAIITKMTLTQVSTWFANARRRLKKENKMTWSPRNKPGENDEDDDKAKNGNGDSDDEEEEDGGGVTRSSPQDGKGGTNRDGHSLDETPPDCSGVRGTHTTMQVYDPPPDVRRPSPYDSQTLGSHQSPISRCPPLSSSYSHHLGPGDGQPPTFLNVPKAPKGYHPNPPGGIGGGLRGGVMTPQDSIAMDTNGSSMTRPDSMCSNSNDSGLSDVTCGYSDGVMDGMRPKIWSLAHVATSEGGYMNHCGGINSTSAAGEKNCPGGGGVSAVGLSSHAPGYAAMTEHGGESLRSLGPAINGALDPSYSNNTHSSLASSSSSSPASPPMSSSSSLTSLLPPAMGPPPQHGWSSMYGNNNNNTNNGNNNNNNPTTINNNVSCMSPFNGGKPGQVMPNPVYTPPSSSLLGMQGPPPPLESSPLSIHNAGGVAGVLPPPLSAAATSSSSSALFPPSSSPAFSHMDPSHGNFYTSKTGLE